MSSYTNNNENGLFNFSQTPSNPFLNYFNAENVEKNAINPNSTTNNQASPTTGYANNTFKTSNTEPNGQSLQANGIVPQSYTPQVGVQNTENSTNNTSQGGFGSFFNSPALSLLNQTAQHSGLGNTASPLVGAINNFGTNLGFAATSADSAANLAAFGVAPGASTEAAAAAADSTASFAAGTSDLGASTVGATLSGTLGAAGLGYLGGGILAHALGENSTGGSIGGAIGAGAGMAVGASSAMLGAELGSFAGPVGAIVGGIGGALFGGLFGNNSTPTSASTASYSLNPGGGLTYAGGSSKNPSPQTNAFDSTAATNFSNLTNAASTALGIQFNNTSGLAVGDSTQHGGAWIEGGSSGKVFFDPSNTQQSQNAYLKALIGVANQAGYTNNQAITDWYNKNYVNSTAGASNQPPSLPNNPNASAGTNSFQQFIANYKAQQAAGAAPTQTTVGTTNVNTNKSSS